MGWGIRTNVYLYGEADVVGWGIFVGQLVAVRDGGEISGVEGELVHNLVAGVAWDGVDGEFVRRLPFPAVVEPPRRVVRERRFSGAVAG